MTIYTADAIAEMQRIAGDPDACPVCGCHRWAVTLCGDGLVCDVCHPGPGTWYPTRAEAEAARQATQKRER